MHCLLSTVYLYHIIYTNRLEVSVAPRILTREHNELCDVAYSTAANQQIESSRRDVQDQNDADMYRQQKGSLFCKYPIALLVTSSITITCYSISASTRTTTSTLECQMRTIWCYNLWIKVTFQFNRKTNPVFY